MLVEFEVLQELRVAVQRRQRVLELVRQSRRHLAETFKIPFQRDRLAQLRHLRDVRQHAERAARAAAPARGQSARPSRRAAARARRARRRHLFAPVKLARLQDSARPSRPARARARAGCASARPFGLAVCFEQRARGRVDDRRAPLESKATSPEGTLATMRSLNFSAVAARAARLRAQTLKLALLGAQLRDDL